MSYHAIIEQFFLSLKGSGLALSANDYHLIGEWESRNVPVKLICRAIETSYSSVEGVGPLGKIYDQDTANLAAQTRGFKSSFKRGETLGNYQEVRVRHLQKRVQDYVES